MNLTAYITHSRGYFHMHFKNYGDRLSIFLRLKLQLTFTGTDPTQETLLVNVGVINESPLRFL